VSLSIDIAADAPGWSAIPSAAAVVRLAVEAAVADAGFVDAEVGAVLADDEEVRALNRRWRNTDQPTNVLSFPAPDTSSQAGPRFLGDIVFAFETITREADAEGRHIEHHLAHLAVHGALHLLGFDHEDGANAETMEGRERQILARLGIPDPYAPTATKRTEPA
jgi:probable rRNA maturation factor